MWTETACRMSVSCVKSILYENRFNLKTIFKAILATLERISDFHIKSGYAYMGFIPRMVAGGAHDLLDRREGRGARGVHRQHITPHFFTLLHADPRYSTLPEHVAVLQYTW